MPILKVRNPDGSWSDIPAIVGPKGPKGDTPIRGTDYWTAADKEEIISGVADELQTYVTPQIFGAKADGVTDDTAAINAAINAIPDGGTLFFPDGTYLVKETDSSTNNNRIAIRIDNRQNITLILSDRAVLKHAHSTSAFYRTIRINNSTNVTIRGGYLVGDSDTHIPEYLDDGSSIRNTHGYGIRVIDSENITIDNVDVSKYYGDPIILCSELSPYKGCENVVIKNCIIHDSLRNGITVTSCQNLLVKDCEIFNITGALPMAGIDIEGEYAGALNEDIIIEGCSFHDNGEWSVTAQLTCHNVQIKNCQLLTRFSMAETATGVVISDSVLTSGVIKSDLVLRNCDVYALGLGNGDVSVIGCHFFTDENSLHNVCVEAANAKARFIGCDFTSPDTQNSYFYTVRANAQAKMIAFSNCTFHLKALKASPFGNMGVSEFVGCTFVGELNTQSLMWLNISGTKTSLNECVFDATALTSYTGQTALITINATNATIKNCIVKAASKVCTFAFNCTGTGEIYFVNNIMPMWENVGIMPTSATKLVLAGNVVSTSESEVLFTAEDKEKLDSIDEIISESGFPTEVEMKAYVDNEIAELKATGTQQSPLFANSVAECTDTTRLYVLPDGYIYSYMAVEKEVEDKPSYTNLLPLAVNADGTDYVGANGEDGYKTGYRINSSKAEVEQAGMCCSGFIPINPSSVIRIKNITVSGTSSPYMFFYKEDRKTGEGTWTSKVADYMTSVYDSTTGVYTIDLTASDLPGSMVHQLVGCFRISIGNINENTIVTCNEEITESSGGGTVIEYEWVNTGLAFVKVLEEDILVDVATVEDISAHNVAPNAHSDIRAMFNDIPNVLQATGNSTVDTMSQKAITDALSNVTVSDTQIASAVADYISKNPISGSGGADITEGTFFIEGSGTTDATAKTSTWVGTSDRITEYYDGLTIRYKIGVEGQSTVTLNVNDLGAKTVYRFNTTKLTTQFPVGSIITLIYHEDLNDGCWITNDYDANTNTQQRVYKTTGNVEYPITARYNTTSGSSYYAEYGRYSEGVTLNPSTKTITATAFKGNLTGNADTATKATQDGSGNNIANTYAKKTSAEEWTFILEDDTVVTKKVVLA